MCIKESQIQCTTAITLLLYFCLANNPVIASDNMVMVENLPARIKSNGIGHLNTREKKKDIERREPLSRCVPTVVAKRDTARFTYGSGKAGDTNVIEVIAEGVSAMQDTAMARDDALRDAQRKAVEKAVGV